MSKFEEITKSISTKKTVVSLSGGLDSTTLLYTMVKLLGAENVHAISFNYNQRHSVELFQAKKTVKKLGVKHQIIDISFFGDMIKGVSAMVKGDVKTPTIHDVLGDPQPVTYVPNRNTILASIVAGYAEANGIESICLGVQRIDSYGYWDTTEDWARAFQGILSLNRKHPIKILTPFVNFSKVEEIGLGKEIGVQFEDTWTCYSPKIDREERYTFEPAGGRNITHIRIYIPCGTCPSCKERETSFAKANTDDPVISGIKEEL